MDTEEMYSRTYQLLYPKFAQLTGEKVVSELDGRDREFLFELILQTTVGDKLKRVRFDAEGNIVAKPELEAKNAGLEHKKDEGNYFEAMLN